jgi:Uma2 family endonuclease
MRSACYLTIMSDLLQLPGIRNRACPLSVRAWHELIAKGLVPKQAELLEGVIVEKMAKSILHTQLLTELLYAMKTALGDTCWVRPESPISIVACDSEPEPDISVVVGKFSDYREHPSTALLVVEISVSTLAEDRAMADIYATASVAEYWLVNALAREVEIFRKPVDGCYAGKEVVSADQILSCQAFPQLRIDLAEFWKQMPD